MHVTFYYTKCSLWIQGNSTKINNLTIAQFFAYYYIEKIARSIEKSVPLDKVGEALRDRILSFLSNEERNQVLNGDDHALHDDKCVTCSRRCNDSNKSMSCTVCKRKQHFNCANIKDSKEREIFLSGEEVFTCNKCIQNFPTSQRDKETNVDARTMTGLDYYPIEASPHKVQETAEERNFIDFKINDQEVLLVEDNESPITNLENKREDIDKKDNRSNEILIRRLREEISRMKEEHANKESRLNEEIDSLKEAYRRCLTECEKEKETRETLQKCFEALDQKPGNQRQPTPNAAGATAATINRRSGRFDMESDKPPKREVICRFFNRKFGCRYGPQCEFKHEIRPPCEDIN